VDQEFPAKRFAADEGEAKKAEGFRFAKSSSRAAIRCKAAKLVGGGAKLHHWGDGSCRLRAE
jgi:hypothetical protein